MGLFDNITADPKAPTSQKAAERPISFILEKEGTPVAGCSCTLYIRPEDLQWTEPSRTSVQQTLGGAWCDTFGPGVPTIVISGHTGWRKAGPLTEIKDWESRFIQLHDTVYKKWHELIAAQVGLNKAPGTIKLYFVDVLDQRSVVVAPNSFVLKRSKNRPLLMQYNLSLTVLEPTGKPVAPISPLPAHLILSVLAKVATIAGKVANIAFLIYRKTKPGGTISDIALLVYKISALVFSISNTILVGVAVFS